MTADSLAAHHISGDPVGQLSLHAEIRAGRTIATRQYHQGALRVLRPHYLDDTGQVTYTIVNPGGGYLGGDEYDIAVEVAEDASMVLTTQSATKVYRTPDSRAYQRSAFRIGPRAVLEYVPDQLIAYRDAVYVQDTVVDMDESATFITTEVITPGWAPDGTLFRYREVHLRQEVRVDDRIAVVDNLIVRPGEGSTPVDSTLIMDGRTHVGTLLAVDRRIDDALVEDVRGVVATALDESLTRSDRAPEGDDAPLWGVSSLDGPGLAIRVLGTSTEQVSGALNAVVDELRGRWRGQDPIHLRKY